jgi:hypothetical protein
MTISYQVLADLAGGMTGERGRDVACPICGPDRHDPANRKRKVLRIWHKEPGFATYQCQRCDAKGFVHDDSKPVQPIDHGELERRQKLRDQEDADYTARQLDKARWLWSRRQPIEGSPAEKYLRDARAYRGPLPATLGFLPKSKLKYHPAMIAAFGLADEPGPGALAIPDENVRGIHLTLLKPDGSGKADTVPDKIFLGSSTGWPIILAPVNDLLGLAITEGIEDALTVHQLTGLGVWAAGSAGRMPPLADKVPDYIETVTICFHTDPDGTGQRGANGLAGLLHARGVEVLLEGSA